jgi:hypothetical protein
MRYQKGLDPVQMASTFAHQSLPLAMEAPRILCVPKTLSKLIR